VHIFKEVLLVTVAESAGLLQTRVADAQTLRLLDALDTTQNKHVKQVTAIRKKLDYHNFDDTVQIILIRIKLYHSFGGWAKNHTAKLLQIINYQQN